MNPADPREQLDAVAVADPETTQVSQDEPRPRGAHPERDRVSVDPMRATDRYRLVTPYFLSSRELRDA